jgi:hypothetical protein
MTGRACARENNKEGFSLSDNSKKKRRQRPVFTATISVCQRTAGNPQGMRLERRCGRVQGRRLQMKFPLDMPHAKSTASFESWAT